MNTDKIYAEVIANEYSAKISRKVIALQKLDKWVKHPARIAAVSLGITSLLLNILGLALLTELFLSADTVYKLFGIVLYAIGIIGMATSPLIYKKVFEYRKRENAYDVVELAKEIIKNSENLTF